MNFSDRMIERRLDVIERSLVIIARGMIYLVDGVARIEANQTEERKAMSKEWDDVAAAFTTLNANIDAENEKLATLGTQLSTAVAANNPAQVEAVATQILASANRLTGAVAPAATAVAAVATAAASPIPTPPSDASAAPAAAAATATAVAAGP